MRLSHVFLVLLTLSGSSAVFAQGHVALGGISGGGGIDGVAEVVGMEGGILLVRCPDQNIYRCETRCRIGLGRDPETALQLFCMEVQNSF